jgi:hypothetical protein
LTPQPHHRIVSRIQRLLESFEIYIQLTTQTFENFCSYESPRPFRIDGVDPSFAESLDYYILCTIVVSATFTAKTLPPLSYSVHDEDKPILCFLIQAETRCQDELSIPQIVCTSNPEEYAWFHSIDQDRMVLTDGIHNQAIQCIEGEGTRMGV